MKLGVQLFSLRNFLETEDSALQAFQACKAMGYETAQYSGKPIAALQDAEAIRRVSEESGLALRNASFSAEEIMKDPRGVIEKMNIMGVSYTMVGVMPKEYRTSPELVEQFLRDMETPTKILLDAGKRINYHNHDYEFRKLEDGSDIMTRLLAADAGWQFMLDVCWARHAEQDPIALMDAIGAERLRQIHFKDMTGEKTEKGKPVFCPCGQGLVDFAPIAEKCKKLGVADIFVEQDNAAKLPDPLGEMEASCKYLRKLLRKD